MKRTLVFATAALAALAATGLAVGKSLDGDIANARAVAGTFAATTASKVETRTCTTADGKTLVRTNGVYTGTSAGDADLTGPATLHASSWINTTDDVGLVSGSLRIDVASGRDTEARFDAVYGGGQIAGLAAGRAHQPSARLVANISAGFSGAGGFTNGKLGGSAGGGAVEVGPGKCRQAAVVKQRSEAHGTVGAASASSITVAGLTCAVPSSLQSRVTALHVGDRAEIKCSLVGSVNTLVRLEAKRK
jgi:hypothetical protein